MSPPWGRLHANGSLRARSTRTLPEILDPTTKHAAVLALVADANRRNQRSQAELCLGLFRAFRDNLHRAVGAGRFEDWAERKFGLKARLAGAFKFVGSKIAALPATLAALDSGELGYTKVREFVNLATPGDEAEWIEYAKTHTNRQLERRVQQKGQEAGEEEKTTFHSKVTAEERQALRAVREKLSKMKGARVAPSEVVGEMAKAFANGLFDGMKDGAAGADADATPEGEGETGEGGKPKDEPKRARNYVSFQPCPICLDTFVPTPEGLLRTSVGAWVKAVAEGAEVVNATPEFFCDCEEEKHRRDLCPNWSLRDATWKKNRYTPVEWGRIVEARDGFVCRNPACREELPLHGSHLTRHADGNPPTPENMRQHCAACNQLIEAGKLRVVGFAPFERYYDADGEFLGYGYDLEPRTEERDRGPDLPTWVIPGAGRCGGRRRGETAPRSGPAGPDGPEPAPETASRGPPAGRVRQCSLSRSMPRASARIAAPSSMAPSGMPVTRIDRIVGARLFAEKPKAFTRRVGSYSAAARPGAAGA